MAAEAVWVLDLILSEALPGLVGNELLPKIQVIVTDKDFKCYGILDSLIQ